MKKKLFSFTLLSATLLSLSACGLSNATSQSSSEVTGTSEAASSQTTAASSEATTPNLDLDTSNLKLVRDSQEENYTVVDNIEDYVGTYKGYITRGADGVLEVQTAVFEDGTFQRIMTNFATLNGSSDYYVDSSGDVKQSKNITTIDGKTYDDIVNIGYARGVLIEKFGNVYLVPTMTQPLNVVIDETGQLNYTDSLLSSALLSYNKPISTDVDWSDFYQNLKNDFEEKTTLKLDNLDLESYFADGEYYLSFNHSDKNLQVKFLEGEVSDIVKNSLTESLNKTDVSEYVSGPNALLHLTYYNESIRIGNLENGSAQFEIIPPGTAIYDKNTGEQYEVIYGFVYQDPFETAGSKQFYAYVGDVFRIITGSEENGKYIGYPNAFVRRN